MKAKPNPDWCNRKWLIAIFFSLAPTELIAGLVVTAGGYPLIVGSVWEDIRVPLSPTIAIRNNFRFFGSSVSNVHVAENGYLAFSHLAPGESDFVIVPLGNNRAMIAPLWED